MRFEVNLEKEDILISFNYLFGLDPRYSYLTQDMRKILEQAIKKSELNKLLLLTQQLSSLLSSLIHDNFLLENILSEEFVKVYLELIFKKDFNSKSGYLINLFYSFFKDLEKLYHYIGDSFSMIKDTPVGERSKEECYRMLIPTLEITENREIRIQNEFEYFDWLFKELNELLKPLEIISPIKTQISNKYPYLRSHSLLYEKSILRRRLEEKAESLKLEKKPPKNLKQLSLFGNIISSEELKKSQNHVEKKISGKIEEGELVRDILELVRNYSDFFQLSSEEDFVKIYNRMKNESNVYPLINEFLVILNFLNIFRDKPEMELFQQLQRRFSDLLDFILNEYDSWSINALQRLTTFLQILIDLTKNYDYFFSDYKLRNYIADIKIDIRDNRIYVNSNLFGKDYKFPVNLKDLKNQVSEERYNWFMFVYYHWD